MRLMLILALICAPLLYSQNDPVLKPAPKAGQSDIRDGEEAFAKGDMDAAIKHFTAAIKAQPENDEVYAYRAAAYVAQGEHDKADADLAEAMKLESKFSLAWNTRGYLRWLRGEFKPAVEDYTAALAYAATDRRVDAGGLAQLYQNRGVAWQDLGNTDRALLDFNECINLLPNEPAFYENRGLIYVDKKLFDVAFKDFDLALELDPKNARAYVNRAWAARLMGDLEQSVRDYSQALRIKPGYGQALIGRGYAWLAWERVETAQIDFGKAAAVTGFEAAGLAGLGDAALDQQDWAGAIEHFLKAYKADQHYEATLRGLAIAMDKSGKTNEGVEYAHVLCNKAPDVSANWAMLGDMRARLGQTERALVALNRALELQPGDLHARQMRLNCHLSRAEFELALDDADRLIASDPAKGHIQKARAYAMRNGSAIDRNHAITQLEAAATAGADMKPLRDHPDFAGIRDVPRFKDLTGSK